MSTQATAPASTLAAPDMPNLRSPGYELFIIVATVMSLVNWALLLLPFNFGIDIKGLLLMMEPVLTVVLLCDFAVRLQAAKGRRWQYLNHGGGWLDFLGSLPMARIFRVFRLWRVVKGFAEYGFRNVWHWFVINRASGALFMVMSLLLITLEVGGVLVLHFEAGAPGANIETGGDALWWGVVTVSTVGYGNLYPVTAGGEITATVMIFSGVAIVGIFTAWAASVFLVKPSDAQTQAQAQAAIAHYDAQQQKVAALTGGGSDAHPLIADLRGRIDELEAELKRHTR